MPVAVPTISPTTLWFFRHLVRRYFRRGFHAVRLRGEERLTKVSGPLIVYANHGSWWDPMVLILLAQRLMPGRRHYAPMEQAALARYSIFRRLGIFGVDLQSSRGAVQFLRTGEAVLASDGVLWITPQGRFADARERPLVFKPGLAALAARMARKAGGCTILPLAIEYTFWDERTPECLLQLGTPLRLTAEGGAVSLEGVFERALAGCMEELQTVAMQRDPHRFTTILAGKAGLGGILAGGERARAFLKRSPYRAEHTTERG